MSGLWQSLAQQLRLELLVQLALAVVLGGSIGLERELRGKPAGLRTNMLIAVGATLFTVLSFHLAGERGDPARIAAQILVGVGFIGAGTILHSRGAVTGLTSAATIWVVAAIGMAIGARAYVEAFGATLLVLLVLTALVRVEAAVGRWSVHGHLLIHVTPDPGALAELEALVPRTGLLLERSETRQENVDQVVELDVRGPRRLHNQLLIAVMHHPRVRAVSAGE